MNYSLSSTALVGIDAARDYLGITNNEKDELITLLINSATKQIENWCNRHFISATYTETFDGENKKNLYLRERPITAVASVKDDTTTLTVDEDYYAYMSEGRIMKASGVWIDSPQNYTVEYTAGYTSLADVPDDIQLACLMIVASAYNVKNRAGIKRESYGSGYSVEYETKAALTDENILSLLGKYKRVYV